MPLVGTTGGEWGFGGPAHHCPDMWHLKGPQRALCQGWNPGAFLPSDLQGELGKTLLTHPAHCSPSPLCRRPREAEAVCSGKAGRLGAMILLMASGQMKRVKV